jgi:WD40 repeat protein
VKRFLVHCQRAVRLLVCSILALPVLLSPAAAVAKSISFSRQIAPIFKRNCNGCHYPGKLKGELDLTTYNGLIKGGKHGLVVKPREPGASPLIEEISGDEPSMPKEGDALSQRDVNLIRQWIKEGALDDTPKLARNDTPSSPPVYTRLPVVTALAYSPDGRSLAVSGFHEVLLYNSERLELTGRLLGEVPRVETIAFSPDGRTLAIAGNAPGLFGQVQIWELSPAGGTLRRAFKISNDSIYGLSWSPQGDRIAVGCADRTSRVLDVSNGRELVKFENHSDWVFGTAFSLDGKRYVSASRDKSIKLVDAASGQYVDDLGKQYEPILCLARHPSEDMVVYGTEQGMVRTYKIAENPNRAAEGKEVNFLKELERLPGPVHAVSFSADGSLVAAAGSEVRIYSSKEGKKVTTLRGQEGTVFSVAFHTRTNHIATAGFDGKIRIYETAKGQLLQTVDSVPLRALSQTALR